MTGQNPFNLKGPGFNIENYEGSHVKLVIGNHAVYGFLKEFTPTGIVLTQVPDIRATEHGLESYFHEEPVLISFSNITTVAKSSEQELGARKNMLLPLELYRGRLVNARNSGSNSLGVLSKILDEHVIELFPSLTPKFDEYGQRLYWNKETPTTVGNVTEVFPITMQDIEAKVAESKLDCLANKKHKETALKKLQLEEIQVNKALQELNSQQKSS